MLLHGGVARSIVGAPPRCEAKSNQNTEPAPFAPGAGAPTGWGDAFDCRSTASVRSEGKPIHRAPPIRTRGGCSYRVGVARSIVGAPPRCEAKSNQYTEPVRSHPGRVLLQGGGDAFDCRSTASVRSEGKPKHRACPIRTRGGCSYRVGVTRSIVGAPPRCEAKANQYTEPALFAPGADAPTWWGDAFDCRSTASVRSEGKPIHRACLIRTRGGCSYRMGGTRSIVGAPPRCEAKSNQYIEPAPFAPGAGAPTGWG